MDEQIQKLHDCKTLGDFDGPDYLFDHRRVLVSLAEQKSVGVRSLNAD